MFKYKANAKINLTLDVTSKREDGYHNIRTVMQSISLADYVTVTPNDSERIMIRCSDERIPCGEKNIAYKAADTFFNESGMFFGVHIDIEKNIPSEAGLGGGSADAAAVLTALNSLSGNIYNTKELCRIGEKIGADVPFCIVGGTCLCEGIGGEINPLSSIPDCVIVIGKGKKGISTKDAYSKIDECDLGDKYAFDISVFDKDIYAISNACSNIFEECADIDEIHQIKKIMLENNALCPHLSGSGSAVYGIFTDIKGAEKACDTLQKSGYFGVVCKPEKKGIVLI